MTTPTPAPIYLPDGAPPTEPYEFGLLSVARVLTEGGQWQIGGAQYDTDNCAEGGYVVGSCPVPLPPAPEQTATVTAEAPEDTGVGITVSPPTADATEGALLLLDPAYPPGAPLPVVEVTYPNGSTDAFPVPRSGLTLDTGQEGAYSIALQNGACGPVEFTVPYEPGTDPLGEMPCLAYELTIANAEDSEFPVTYAVQRGSEESPPYAAVTRDPTDSTGYRVLLDVDNSVGPAWPTGQLQPGTQATAWVVAGDHTLTYGAPDGTVVQSVITVPTDGPASETITYQPPPGSSHAKSLPHGLHTISGCGPITVYHRAECNAVGWASQDVPDIARRRLLLVEDEQAEAAFWDICLMGRIDEALLPLGEDAVPFKQGIGALQHYAARAYNAKPTLHAPRWTFPFFIRQHQVRPEGTVQRTYLNERVAFGAGYHTDSEPEGEEFWLFATGAVTARRSEPMVHPPVIDPPTNTYLALAERTYAFDTDCLLMAVRISTEGLG